MTKSTRLIGWLCRSARDPLHEGLHLAEECGAAITENATHQDFAEPEDVVGRGANVLELAALKRALPNINVTVEHAWSGDGFRVTEYVASGTQAGSSVRFRRPVEP